MNIKKRWKLVFTILVLLFLTTPVFALSSWNNTRISSKDAVASYPQLSSGNHSYGVVWVDDRNAMMTAKEFITKSGKEFQRIEGELTRINYKGFGYTGNNTYKLNVTDFEINTTVKKGEHKIVTEIIHGDLILYRNEKVIVID